MPPATFYKPLFNFKPRCSDQWRSLAFELSDNWTKTDHQAFLAGIPIQSENLLSQQPCWDGMFSKIPDEEVPYIKLWSVIRNALIEREVCPGYTFQSCDDPNYHAKNQLGIVLCKSAESPEDGQCHQAQPQMWVEFKRGGETDDPFSDDKDSAFEINTDYKGKIRGQLIAYAEATTCNK